MNRRDPARTGRLVELALVAALVAFALQAVRLALGKYFTIDEFQYAHAAWLVARGAVPYRDFFEVHFPLVYQALAPVFVFAGDDPTAIVFLRAGMLGFLALGCAGVALLNRDAGRIAVLAAPLFLLALPAFVTLATEIRPDAAAFALFAASLGVLRTQRLGDRSAALASGLLLVGAVWSSQKAVFYGSVMGLGLALDLLASRREGVRKQVPLLRHPTGYLLGVALGATLVAIYLTASGSWGDWWAWCFVWAAEHQQRYPGFSFRRYFDPIALDSLWLLSLAALGTALTVRRLLASGRAALRDPDVLLLAALCSTFASFALQRAPYPYSLLPFLGIAAALAARGAAFLLGGDVARPVRLAATAGLAVLLALQAVTLARFSAARNERQLEVLERIATLTAPSDHAYDNSGGYVSRPHAYRYFYTDSFLRESLADTLVDEVPRAILETGTVLHLLDLRFDTLPPALRAFLVRHFQPLDGDVALWGQRYTVAESGRLEDRFLAVRTDRYFVAPPEALERGALTIDGVPVAGAPFTLERGEHRVVYTGPPGTLDILWLPRDGRFWQPQHGLPPTFSRLF